MISDIQVTFLDSASRS